MAQRYSEWAQQQIERAERRPNRKARNDRLALAEYYWRLAEQEMAAAERLAAIAAPAATPNAAGPMHNLISTTEATAHIEAQAPVP